MTDYDTPVHSDRYRMHPLLLHFLDPEMESAYRTHTESATRRFARGSWLLVIGLAIVFGILDKYFFAGYTGRVFAMRLGVILAAAFMSFIPHRLNLAYLLERQGSVFIIILGLFCNALIFMDTTASGLSLWFAGLFLVFPGVFITPGMGFRHSIVAMFLIPVFFNLLYFIFKPFQISEFLFYNIFLGGMVIVYIFTAYLVEQSIRRNYTSMIRLQDSKEEVHRLTGLLPICSHCKKIRDDKGYWQRVETYIQAHSQARFSHGMCPACMEEIYGDKKWYKKMKNKKKDTGN